MKPHDQRAKYHSMSLHDLKAAALALEKQIHLQTMAVELDKAKDVSTVGNRKRELARILTIAAKKLATKDQS